MGRREDPTITALDEIGAHCIGIRQAVAVLAARLALRLSAADADELERIIDHSRAIQALYAPYRAQVSAAYQGQKTMYTSPRSSILLEIIEDAQRDGVLDQETARVMRLAAAPRCRHGVPTVVLRNNRPCCARCWQEAQNA